MSAPPKLGAMARMRAAMAKLKPTPGDAKSDLLVVIASRLIMNSGNPVRVSDVLNASSCAPADAWVARAFGKDVRLTAEMVETALSRAKDHFQRAKDGRFVMKGWPLARRLECRVNEDWGAEWHPDPRLGITLRDLKPDRVPLAKRAREPNEPNDAPVSPPAEKDGNASREVVDVIAARRGAEAPRNLSAPEEADAPSSRKRARTSSEKQKASEAAARESAARSLERGKKGSATATATATAEKNKNAAAKKKRAPTKKKEDAPTVEAEKNEARRGKRPRPRPRPSRGTEEELDESDDDEADLQKGMTKEARDDDDDDDEDEDASPEKTPTVDPGDVASNVRFFGEARGSDVHRHRTYYDGFDVLTRKGSELIEAKYVTGDLVYCLPGAEDEAMYLAQIESVFSDPSGQWVDCAWLERGSDLRALIKSDEVWREVNALEEEVFLTLAVNTNAVQTIEGKCRVVTEAQWEKERAEAGKKTTSFGQTKKKKEPKPPQQETFVCRRALVGVPPGEKKKKPSGKSADSWAKAAVAGMFAPVTFEEGVGFRAVLPTANKGKTKKGKGKR